MLNKYLQDVFFGVLGTIVILMLFAYILMFSAIPEKKVLMASMSTENEELQDYISKSFISFGYNGEYIDEIERNDSLWAFYGGGQKNNETDRSILFINDTTDHATTIHILSENRLSLRSPEQLTDKINIKLSLLAGEIEHDTIFNISIEDVIKTQDSMILGKSNKLHSLFNVGLVRISNDKIKIIKKK
ncbi:hypothetical protein [uncultured Psychroserpens sp.]|uniref:hypothetical protein n=1 Tax=uncultured Psychroserpens sp. TaxID=255436 RepID=UPI002634DCF1|nr:hypothetical protein [uncultured Psychroserpens sp.]